MGSFNTTVLKAFRFLEKEFGFDPPELTQAKFQAGALYRREGITVTVTWTRSEDYRDGESIDVVVERSDSANPVRVAIEELLAAEDSKRRLGPVIRFEKALYHRAKLLRRHGHEILAGKPPAPAPSPGPAAHGARAWPRLRRLLPGTPSDRGLDALVLALTLTIPFGLVCSRLLFDEAVRNHARLSRIASGGTRVAGRIIESHAPWRNKGWSKAEIDLDGSRRAVVVTPRLEVDATVELICDRAGPQCETEEVLAQHARLWPFTPLAVLWGLCLAAVVLLPIAGFFFNRAPR